MDPKVPNEPSAPPRIPAGKEAATALGFEIGPSETPIVPTVVGDDIIAYRMARMLQDEGVFANVAVSPAVPPGKSLIRTSYMATHTDEHLDEVLGAFQKVGRALGLIP